MTIYAFRVNGVRIKYTRPKWNAEAVVIPVSSFYELSVDRNNPWAVTLPGVSMPYSIDIDKTPKNVLRTLSTEDVSGAYLNGSSISVPTFFGLGTRCLFSARP